jgi:alpha-L-fucosidase
VYHDTVGQNCVLELDFAIDRSGRVDPNHAAAYAQFGDWIRSCYGAPLANTTGTGTVSIVLQVPPSTPLVDRFWVREDLVSVRRFAPAFSFEKVKQYCGVCSAALQTQGERIRAFSVDVMEAGSGTWTNVNNGTAVGNKRIVVLPEPIKASALRLNVLAAVAEPYVADFAVFSPCPSS